MTWARPDDRPSLTLVVPLFNEEQRVDEFFPPLADFIAAQPDGSQLLFVDDGSQDSTVLRLQRHLEAHADGRVALLRRSHEGKGAAVAAGLRASTADVGAFCDLDLSTPLPDLERIVAAAARADTLALGSRDLAGSVLTRSQNPLRKTLGRIYNRLVQATLTPGVVDTQCGAKAARTELWSQLLPYCRQRGFAWDAELVAVALALGIEVREIAISWHHDDRSRVRVGRDGLAMVKETPRLMRSAADARARVQTTAAAAPGADTSSEVFDATNAARMQSVDRTHWWFRSKAAFVSTALRRTGGSTGPTGWLVDAGGGSGGVTGLLGWPSDRTLVVEGSRELVRRAHRSVGLLAAQGVVQRLPVADGSIEVVALLDVIEHLDEPGSALEEAARVLRPGGRLVVNVPAHQWLWSEADVELGHHRRYTRRSLRKAVRSHGFEPEVLTHVFSWLTLPVWAVRVVSRPASAELGLDRSTPLITVASLVLTALERQLVGRVPLPLGTSVLCVARRTGGPGQLIQ